MTPKGNPDNTPDEKKDSFVDDKTKALLVEFYQEAGKLLQDNKDLLTLFKNHIMRAVLMAACMQEKFTKENKKGLEEIIGNIILSQRKNLSDKQKKKIVEGKMSLSGSEKKLLKQAIKLIEKMRGQKEIKKLMDSIRKKFAEINIPDGPDSGEGSAPGTGK